MLRLQTKITVDGLTGKEVFDFLVDPHDRAYRAWWPGVHLRLHLRTRHADHVGDVIYMDEYVGKRRLRMSAVVREADPARKLVWQFKRVIALPARLSLEFADLEGGGVQITHTVQAGFGGAGRLLDPLVALFFSRTFAEALDDHVRTEFPLLRDRLGQIRAAARDA